MEELYHEMSFISYYFHWSKEEVMGMEHRNRRKWCSEISLIHQKINPSKEKMGKNIFALETEHV